MKFTKMGKISKVTAKTLLVVLLTATLLISGCGSKNADSTDPNSSVTETDSGVVMGDEPVSGTVNSLTGVAVPDGRALPMPLAVMIDNHAAARPQSGLSKADVVYEMMAEGMITRYMAIFYSQDPGVVGPVRSARPYFIDAAMEYGAGYIHVGGSPQALADLKALGVPQIEGLYSSNIYRDKTKGKKMPHNAYAKTANLIAELTKKGQLITPVESPNAHFVFGQNAGALADHSNNVSTTSSEKVDASTGEQVKITYRSGYKVSYTYDAATGVYTRFINGKPHLDEVGSVPVAPANVLVQFADFKVMDDKGRLEIDLIGSGKGFLYTNGQKVPITWSKGSRASATEFFGPDGEKVIMKPGQTWIQVVPGIKNIGG